MELILGNCLEKLKNIKDNSVDAIVTDPPYGISFMGKKWDYDVPSVDIWKECLRVLKPGGHLLSFAGTRTYHRMAIAIEDAGFEIRDMIAWVYGSGFPKSLNIGKAVDKLQGNEREVSGRGTAGAAFHYGDPGEGGFGNTSDKDKGTASTEWNTTKGTSEWEGWGTALKPALEPITVARKPLGEKTVAENCLKWGVGGINIDGCRVGIENNEDLARENKKDNGMFGVGNNNNNNAQILKDRGLPPVGRFPANLIHDGSDEVVGLFPQTHSRGNYKVKQQWKSSEKGWQGPPLATNSEEGSEQFEYDNGGNASRFFYCAKASKRERNIGCEELKEKQYSHDGRNKEIENPYQRNKSVATNSHPTVKPIALMEYLVKLVSREGQVVLDPFMGSGTTGMACKKLDREFIGIEMIPEYMEIAKARIKGVKKDEQLELV